MKVTDKEIQNWKNEINKMSHIEMASLQRFAPSGHPVFNTTMPLYDYFRIRFSDLGGMTTAISKAIGW